MSVDHRSPIESAPQIHVNDSIVLVDAEDYRLLKHFRWRIRCGYAVTGKQFMHRVVMDAPPNMLVDHVNRNRLDNRKSNLRLATCQENNCNTTWGVERSGVSQYRGVYACERKNQRKPMKRPWRASLSVFGKRFHLGYFSDEVSAAVAYDAAAKQHHGEFAVLNFPSN